MCKKGKIVHRVFVFWYLLSFWTFDGIAQQVTDENFNYPVAVPMYKAGNGSLILFDEAHNNASTLKDAYAAFGKLLATDGDQVVSSKEIDSIMCWGGTGFIVPPHARLINCHYCVLEKEWP